MTSDFNDFAVALNKNRKTMMSSYHISVIVEKDKDGYFAFSPDLQGCYTQGESYEEVISNIRDAIRLHIEDRLADGEQIELPDAVALTTVEVAL
jgi:predicted RNase H-like HicB family nuclease